MRFSTITCALIIAASSTFAYADSMRGYSTEDQSNTPLDTGAYPTRGAARRALETDVAGKGGKGGGGGHNHGNCRGTVPIFPSILSQHGHGNKCSELLKEDGSCMEMTLIADEQRVCREDEAIPSWRSSLGYIMSPTNPALSGLYSSNIDVNTGITTMVVEFPYVSGKGRTTLTLQGLRYASGPCASFAITGGTGCFNGIPNSQAFRMGLGSSQFSLTLFADEIPESYACGFSMGRAADADEGGDEGGDDLLASSSSDEEVVEPEEVKEAHPNLVNP